MTTSTVLVTGATGGIGLRIARRFAEQGWMVIVGAREATRGEEVAGEVGGHPVLLDVTNANSIAAAATTVTELDVLIDNAGISLDTGAPVTETEVDVFRRTYETNVFGVVAVTNAFLPALRRSAHPRIVNISSGRIAHLEHRPQPAVRSSGGRHRLRRRIPLLEDRAQRADRVLCAGARWRQDQGQRARPRSAGHEPQPPSRSRGRRPSRSGRGRNTPCTAARRRPHRPTVLLGRDGRAVVNAAA